VPCVQPGDESASAFIPGFAGILAESDLVVDGEQVLWSQLIDNVELPSNSVAPKPTTSPTP
jgi:hypothetical protein